MRVGSQMLFWPALAGAGLLMLVGCQQSGGGRQFIITAPGEAAPVAGIFPGPPQSYYAQRLDGTVEQVFPTLLSPATGEMMEIAATIPFASGSAQVDSNSAGIQKALDTIRARPDAKVYVEGHTDALGEGNLSRANNAAFARDLSLRRGRAVQTALQRGLGGTKPDITVLGYGFSAPVVAGGLPADQAANRRVVVRVIYSANPVGASGYWYRGQVIPPSNLQFSRVAQP